MVKMLGPAVAVMLCVAAFGLALRSAATYGSANALSIAAAAVAVTAMSQCLILAARFRVLEPVLGGLDRMYRAHKYLGITALAMMIVHNLVEPDFEEWVKESWSGDLASDIGEVAFPALLTLILLSWIKRIPRIRWEIPYQFWRFSHRLTGVFFMMIAVHQLLVDRPFGWTDPLSMYLNGACVIGISCYTFTEFIDKPWRRRTYEVASLERQAGAIEIALRPLDRPMHWKPGQFAFLTVPGSGSRLGEPHPFTMINPPRPEGGVCFAVKALGDWTRHLPMTLKPGTTVQIEGPYGRFNFRKFNFRKRSQRQIWIAGGIGITPFLAWIQSLSIDEARRIHLLYSALNAQEAFGLEILAEAKAAFPQFSFDVVFSQSEGRPNAERLIANAPFNLKGADFFFCGPPNMRKSILEGLNAQGVTPRRVNFELFEFR